jgi:predicted glutamine amidotransferase
MCRFTLYLGPPIQLSSLVLSPTNSIIRQSFHSKAQDDPLNGDGFGIAWYVPELSEVPALFRSVTPAWNNTNLLELARVVQSPLILAHVRAATKHGGQSEANCHPFRRGRHAFMHNGDVGGWTDVRRPLVNELTDQAFAAIEGNTDSEHLFALAIDELETAPGEGAHKLGAVLRRVVARTIELVRRHGHGALSYLNLALTDGEAAAACRFTTKKDYDGESLWYHTGRAYVCEDGVCRMLAPVRGRGSVLVSSEPLSDDDGWDPVPRNSLVLVHADGRTELAPIAA